MIHLSRSKTTEEVQDDRRKDSSTRTIKRDTDIAPSQRQFKKEIRNPSTLRNTDITPGRTKITDNQEQTQEAVRNSQWQQPRSRRGGRKHLEANPTQKNQFATSSTSSRTATGSSNRFSRRKSSTRSSRRRYAQPSPQDLWNSQSEIGYCNTMPPSMYYYYQDASNAAYISPPFFDYSGTTASSPYYDDTASLLDPTTSTTNTVKPLQPYPLTASGGIVEQPSYCYYYYQYPPVPEITSSISTNSCYNSNNDFYSMVNCPPPAAWATTASYESTAPPPLPNANATTDITTLSPDCSTTRPPYYSYDYDGTTFYYSPSDVQLFIPSSIIDTTVAQIDSTTHINAEGVSSPITNACGISTTSTNNNNNETSVHREEVEIPLRNVLASTAVGTVQDPPKVHSYTTISDSEIEPATCPTVAIPREEYYPFYSHDYHHYWQPAAVPNDSISFCGPGSPFQSQQQHHYPTTVNLSKDNTVTPSKERDAADAFLSVGAEASPANATGSTVLGEDDDLVQEENSATTVESPKREEANESLPQVSKPTLLEDELLAPLLKAFHLESSKDIPSSVLHAVITYATNKSSGSYGFDDLLTKLDQKTHAISPSNQRTNDGTANAMITNNSLTGTKGQQQLKSLLLLALETKCEFDVIHDLVLNCMNTSTPYTTRRAALAELPVQNHPKNVPKSPVQMKKKTRSKKKQQRQRHHFLEFVLEKLICIITNHLQAIHTHQQPDPSTISERHYSKKSLQGYEECQRLLSVAQLLQKKGIHMNHPTKLMFEKYCRKFTNNVLHNAIQDGKSWDWIKTMVLDRFPASIIEKKKDNLYPCFVAATCEASSLDIVFQLLVSNTCWVPSQTETPESC